MFKMIEHNIIITEVVLLVACSLNTIKEIILALSELLSMHLKPTLSYTIGDKNGGSFNNPFIYGNIPRKLRFCQVATLVTTFETWGHTHSAFHFAKV